MWCVSGDGVRCDGVIVRVEDGEGVRGGSGESVCE